MAATRPYNLVAELTYRCPLRCAYCSNPLGYREVRDALDAAGWSRAFAEASELGCVHVGLTGGEPTLREDLEEIVRGAAEAGLYTHLVTAGTPIAPEGLARLAHAGLRSVQVSVQDAEATASDRIAGAACFERKLELARSARALGLPLTLNVVLHRHNLARVREIIALARDLGALRLELANTQYHGWALHNRSALLPDREQLDAAAAVVREERGHPGPEILYVLPDYFGDRPKPCMGGWGRHTMVVTPAGRVLPCHAAETVPGLVFDSVREKPLAAIWHEGEAFRKYRGTEWMREPCRRCPRRDIDWGGCRCQALAVTGDAAAADPACSKSPHHAALRAAAAARRAASSGTVRTTHLTSGSAGGETLSRS